LNATYNTSRIGMLIAGCLAASALLAQTIPNQSSRRNAYGSGPGQQELPPGLTTEPRIDAAVQYASNLQLSSTGGDSAIGLEVSPGAYVAYRSPSFVGAVDYSLITRVWDDGDLNDVSHLLAANGRWVAVPDLFSISGDASYGDVVIDGTQGGNFGNMGVFNTSNITEQATASVRPSLQKRFKDFEAALNYSYGRVWYLDEGKGLVVTEVGTVGQDSINQTAEASLALVPGARRISGKAFYTWQDYDFEVSLPYRFERAGVEGGWELTRTLSLVGDVGKESQLDVDTSAGGLDSDFWSAGMRWQPNQRSSAEARYGERFFGSSYSVEVRHSNRYVTVNASYSEAPEVDSRRVNFNEFEPGELPPWFNPDIDASAYNSQPYVAKAMRLGVSAEGSRTSLSLRGYITEREYLNDQIGDEDIAGVALVASRRVAANVSVDGQATYVDRARGETSYFTGFPQPATHTYDTDLTLRGNRNFGPRLVASVEAGYFNSAGTNDYDGWWLGLRGRWYPTFGR
jgi:hypothetical protein